MFHSAGHRSQSDPAHKLCAGEASFLIAVKRLNVIPEECLVIESAVAGIKADKTVGMKSIAVTNTVPKEKLVLADLLVDSLDEVSLDIVNSI